MPGDLDQWPNAGFQSVRLKCSWVSKLETTWSNHSRQSRESGGSCWSIREKTLQPRGYRERVLWYRLRHDVLFCLSVYPGNRAFFWPAMNILLETHLRIHNTTTLSVLHLISFWVVQIDYCAIVGGRGKLHRDPRKTSAANRIAGSRLHRSRLAEEVNTVTPACSALLLAPVYVSKCILSYKTINCAQI